MLDEQAQRGIDAFREGGGPSSYTEAVSKIRSGARVAIRFLI